jgi:hypothetical protein
MQLALKMSWKTPKNKSVDTTRNEYLGFGEGDYDNEFLMRHDLQQLEAEISNFLFRESKF